MANENAEIPARAGAGCAGNQGSSSGIVTMVVRPKTNHLARPTMLSTNLEPCTLLSWNFYGPRTNATNSLFIRESQSRMKSCPVRIGDMQWIAKASESLRSGTVRGQDILPINGKGYAFLISLYVHSYFKETIDLCIKGINYLLACY